MILKRQLGKRGTFLSEAKSLTRIFVVLILLICPLSSLAHSPLLSSSPLDGSYLVQSPSTVELNFKEPVKLIKAELYKNEDSQKVSTLNKILGIKKGLLVPFASKFVIKNAAVHNLLLDPLSPGQYSFFWRAIGVDGHLVKGEFNFSVVGN